MNDNCPYSDECGILSSCDVTRCRVKELFDDFYKVEKLYTEAKQENEKLEQYKKSKQASYEKLQDRCNKLEWENRELKQKLEKIREKCEKYNANVGNTIIANPIQDLYDILQIIEEK